MADKPLTIVALGDSTTAGTPGFRSPAEAPPDGEGNPESQYAYWMIERHPDWRVINRGVAGERSDEILERFDFNVPEYKPDLVIILAGVNDLYQGRSANSVKENLIKLYAKARESKSRVMACTILPYNGASPKVLERMNDVNTWIRKYAEGNGFLFCDTSKAVENPDKSGTLLTAADGLHPDVAGYRKMGEAIADVIDKNKRP